MNLKEFLKPFGITHVPDAQLVGRSYYVVKDKHLLGMRPLYTGECIAHVRGTFFFPSTTFLQYIGKHAKKHIMLSPKGEWLFICGRDVFGKSIVSHNSPLKGERVVVLNQHKECLGYGDVTAPFDSKRVVVRRLFDLGDLLRRER